MFISQLGVKLAVNDMIPRNQFETEFASANAKYNILHNYP